MSSTTSTSGRPHAHQPDGASAPFKWPAFILGLCFPGLGHWSRGERGRAVRILAGFLILWFGGLLIGGPASVALKDPPHSTPNAREKNRLWFLAQAGAGPIALVTAVIGDRLMVPRGDDRMEVTMPDRTTGTISRRTPIGHALDFGTLYCALAGLMNVAVALDAGRRPDAERRGRGR